MAWSPCSAGGWPHQGQSIQSGSNGCQHEEQLTASKAAEHRSLGPAPRWQATADQLVEREDLRQQINAGLNSLPEAYRLPLVLREVEEWDMATICAGLGIGLSTLKARLSRARTLLREKLDPSLGAGLS